MLHPIDHQIDADDQERLRLAREDRIRPGRDNKVLTAWNSLAIGGLAIGSLVSGNASATAALLHLSRLCDRDNFRAAAEKPLVGGAVQL